MANVVAGESNDPGVPAVYGENTFNPETVIKVKAGGEPSVTGPSYAVEGFSPHGYSGVLGRGGENGVFGMADQKRGSGVYGRNDEGNGVAGHSDRGVGVKGSGRVAGRFEGDVEVTGDLRLTNADCAEEWDIAPAQQALPGSVMVLDDEGRLEVCTSGYDRKVVGVLSGAGQYRPAIVLDRQGDTTDRRNLAVLGKVYCMADASYGPISVGDLLTSSPTPAHAMRSGDRERSFGSVIGKALGPLPDGNGLIPILVALQ